MFMIMWRIKTYKLNFMRRRMENILQIKVPLLQGDIVDHCETEKKN